MRAAKDRVMAPLAHSSMQGSYATFVQRIWIGPILDQKGDHFGLRSRIPVARTRHAIRRVVEGFRSPSVSRPNVGTVLAKPIAAKYEAEIEALYDG